MNCFRISLFILLLTITLSVFTPTPIKQRIRGSIQYGIFQVCVNVNHLITGSNSLTRPSIESKFMLKALQYITNVDHLPQDPEEFRERFIDKLCTFFPFPLSGVSREIKTIPMRNNEHIQLLSLSFENRKSSNSREITIFYLHGGGFIEGGILGYDGVVSGIMTELQSYSDTNKDDIRFNVYFPEYRLAPNYTLPTAIYDCVDTYRYLIEELKLNSDNIIFMGDSAGGHLCFSTTLQIQHEGLPLPKVVIPLSPWTDLTQSLPSLQTNIATDPALHPSSVQKMSDWSAQIGRAHV